MAAAIQQMRHMFPQHLRRKPLRYALSMLSITVAAVLFTTLRVMHISLTDAFRTDRSAMFGRASWTASAPGGLSAELLAQIEAIEGVDVAPVVTGSAVAVDAGETLTLIGVDPLRDPQVRSYDPRRAAEISLPTLLINSDSVIVSRRLADQYGWKIGARLALLGPSGCIECVVAGLLPSGGPADYLGGRLAIMPMAAAQRFFAKTDVYDRFDIALTDPSLAEQLRGVIGNAARLESVDRPDPTFAYLQSQFQTIFGAIAAMALLIGVFLVYNSAALSIVERSKEIAIYRSLGARRGELLAALLIEFAIVGFTASVIGVIIGVLTADQALTQLSNTMGMLRDMGTLQARVTAGTIVPALAAGVIAALVGALSPAWDAVRTPPVAIMRQGGLEQQRRRWHIVGFLLAGPMLIGGYLLVRHPALSWRWTLVGLSIAMLSAAAAGPQLLAWLGSVVQRFSGNASAPRYLAIDGLVRKPARTSLTVVAFGGSLSLVVALAGMVDSLHYDISRWMDRLFAFDMTATTVDMTTSVYPQASFPCALADEIRGDPRIADVYGVRSLLVPFRHDDVMVIAYNVSPFQEGRIARGLSENPAHDRAVAERLKRGEVTISHNLARLAGLRVGDLLPLETPSGRREFRIADMQEDHSWFRGVIFFDLDVYAALWHDRTLSYVDMFIKPGADPEAIRRDWSAKWVRYGLLFHRSDEIKSHALKFTRDWFAVANLQVLLAVVIGGVGIANTLTVSILSQSRQIALLRAIGASQSQVRRMLLIEASGLGLLGALAGCVMGLVILRFFAPALLIKAGGLDPTFIVPWGVMAATIAVAVLIALAAAAFPVRAMHRLDVVRAISYE